MGGVARDSQYRRGPQSRAKATHGMMPRPLLLAVCLAVVLLLAVGRGKSAATVTKEHYLSDDATVPEVVASAQQSQQWARPDHTVTLAHPEEPVQGFDKLVSSPPLGSDQSTSVHNAVDVPLQRSACQALKVLHVLHYSGCHSKAVESQACLGTCPSYVQSERSCFCCQAAEVQEATFTLDCPSLEPPYRHVKLRAPNDCLCRSCDDSSSLNPHAIGLIEPEPQNDQAKV